MAFLGGGQDLCVSLLKISLAQHKIGLKNILFHDLFTNRFINYKN